jgi:hypothetical protein
VLQKTIDGMTDIYGWMNKKINSLTTLHLERSKIQIRKNGRGRVLPPNAQLQMMPSQSETHHCS